MVFGCFSTLTGGAVGGIVSKAGKGPKESQNAFDEFHEKNREIVAASNLYDRFSVNWNAVKNLERKKPNGKPNRLLLQALWKTFSVDVWKAAFLKLFWGGTLILSIAFFIFRILDYIKLKQADKEGQRGYAYILCSFFFVSMMLMTMALQQMASVSATLGYRVKAALITAVYRKMLIREGFESKADVVSLVAKDCAKVAEACTSLQFLWSGVVESIAIFAVLISFTGVTILPGVGLLFVFLPVQYGLGLWMAVRKHDLAKISATRVKLMEEIFRAVKLIKMYGWEKYFHECVHAVRSDEVNLSKKINIVKAIILGLVFTLPPFFAVVIFGTHEAVSKLDSSLTFVTLTFFNTLRLPFVKLPKGLRDVLDALSALDRIQEFLFEKDLTNRSDADLVTPGSLNELVYMQGRQGSPAKIESTQSYSPSDGVSLVAASFSYGDHLEPALKEVNLILPKGNLCMVAGPVASGKTTVLRGVLGQVTLRGGSRKVGGRFAYVPQVPWTAIGTVRDNITFGRDWDEKLYRKVIHACALETDLDLMPDSDLTLIGERGGNLSGGQKQRIALARAAYSGADVFVLDSPLSAVDMYTCQHIFRHCIENIMLASGGTVVLATHQVELFPRADLVVVMDGGKATYSGPYQYQRLLELFPNASGLVNAAGGAVMRKQMADDRPEPTGRDLPSKNLVLKPDHSKAASSNTAKNKGRRTSKSSLGGGSFELLASQARPSAVAAAVSTGGTQSEVADSVVAAAAAEKRNYYWWYVQYFGVGTFLLAMFHFIWAQITRIFADIWIRLWVARRWPDRPDEYYIMWFFGYVMVFWIGANIRAYFYIYNGLKVSDKMHTSVLAAMFRAPMAYYNSTPIGGLLAFFSKDLDVLDDIMVDNMTMYFIFIYIVLSTLGVVIGNIPIYAAIVGGLFIVFLIVTVLFSRACTFMKGVSNRAIGDVVSQISESLNGIAVVRAFTAERRFLEDNLDLQDKAASSCYALSKLALWMSFRLDTVACLLVVTTLFLAVANDSLPAAGAGLAVSNSYQILLFFALMTITMADIQTNMGSCERASQLQATPVETDLHGHSSSAAVIPQGWPSRGEVVFEGVVMSYLPNKPPVLRGVDFTLQAGEKIGVVGRTGAGKSTLIIALYRMAELTSGHIKVDGLDIGTASLREYRSRFAIIPQEPIMFSGTLRSNLDPFRRCSDKDVVQALEDCLLGPTLRAHPKGLEAPVEHLGANFSLGQQQLVCLARARLNPSRLMLLDEATAALDSDTDAAVQEVLRRVFADRTIVTIAHRLDTIIDSDRILAMDAGRVAELEAPELLLENPQSIFYNLCKNTGPAQFEALRSAARSRKGAHPVAGAASLPPVPPAVAASAGPGLVVGQTFSFTGQA